MAGHSKFKNIMHRKGAQDKKRAKIFSRLIREITVAAQGGLADPEKNPRLRAAVATAQSENMPRDTIERAIKRGSGAAEGDNYQDVRYEGYGPGGVAIIVEALTDNRNRTAAAVRAAFSKHGGNLGETGSVSHSFDRLGVVRLPPDVAAPEAVFEVALDNGASDVESDNQGHEISCPPDVFHTLRDALQERFTTLESAEMVWKPRSLVPVPAGDAATLLTLLEALDNSDDVQSVAANYDIEDHVLETLVTGT